MVRKTALTIFIISVIVMTIVSLLSIWDFVGEDMIEKATYTVLVLLIATIIAVVAGRSYDSNDSGSVIDTNTN